MFRKINDITKSNLETRFSYFNGKIDYLLGEMDRIQEGHEDIYDLSDQELLELIKLARFERMIPTWKKCEIPKRLIAHNMWESLVNRVNLINCQANILKDILAEDRMPMESEFYACDLQVPDELFIA